MWTTVVRVQCKHRMRHLAVGNKLNRAVVITKLLLGNDVRIVPVNITIHTNDIPHDTRNRPQIVRNHYDRHSSVQLGEHHSYMVTATYDKGVSAPSAPLDVVVGALCGVTVSDISVTVTDSRIVVTGAEGLPVSISGADGRLYYAGIPASTLTVSVPVGVYVVTTPGTTAKVMVR